MPLSLTPQEKELLQYCQCYNCTRYWLNPLRYISLGGYTSGCIKALAMYGAGYDRDIFNEGIRKAKQHYDNLHYMESVTFNSLKHIEKSDAKLVEKSQEIV